ncbi:hypothetical protein [Pseudomonas schmalbachii]|uniref:DUF3649 domain-containing protein n=1 Tax=Pseudomonas schmalbachii TaxID=2816993 RepID=A0ABS3TXK6_9PSED|nr:hypothetical protein [Pseudomonas schmalbachii]MBO3278093.1 hypothetical protein [Pseudomonas schmalbachii]
MSYRSQAVASTFLGTPLTLALCALYAEYGPGLPYTRFVVAVFLLVPVWCAVMIWGLKRAKSLSCWIGLGGALAIAGGVLFLARHSSGG